MSTVDELLTTINTRLEAVGQSVEPDKLKALVKEQFDAVLADPEFKRKMRFAPDEKKLIGSKFQRWGLSTADIELLYDITTAARNIGGPGPSEELTNAFNAVSDAYYLPMEDVRKLDRQAIDNLFPRVTKGNRAQRDAAIRAMDTAETGYGLELIGAQYVGDLWQAARTESRVASLIGSFEMTAPVAYLPVEVDFPALLHVAESTSSTITAHTTSKTGSNRVSVTAHKFVIHQIWSGEMEEDSIIAYLPFLRGQAQKSLAYYMDDIALNGDSTLSNGINAHDTTQASTVCTTAFDGIRHLGLVDNTGNAASAANAAVSPALFRAAKSRMIDATYFHDWGHPNDPNDVVYIVDPYTGDQMLTMDEFMTRDKAGNEATLFAGQVAKVFNHPVIASIALKKSSTVGTVDADTAGDNLYGSIVTFNRNGAKWGWRRRIKIETEREVQSDQSRIVYSLRLGLGLFSPTGAQSGQEWADTTYYVNV